MTAPSNNQITVFIQKSQGAQATAATTDKDMSSTESNAVFTVVAHLDESFDFGISAEYQQPYANIANDLVGNIPIVGKLTKTTPITSPYLSANYWQGSETQEMTLNLILEADSDPLTEIRTPVLNLLSLVSPQYVEGTGLMLSPLSQITLSKQQVQDMMKMATTVTAQVGGSVASGLSDTLTAIKDNVKTEAQAGITGVLDNALGGLVSLGSSAVNYAKNFTGSIASSIEGGFNAVSGAVSNVVSGAANAVGLDITTKSDSQLSSQKAVSSSTQQSQQSSQVTPSANSGAYSPTAAMVSKLKNVVSIKIGTYAYFPAVIVTGVNVTFQHDIDAYTGWPLSAAVQLTFKPMFSQTVGDVEQVFQTSINTTTSEDYLTQSQNPVNGSLTSTITAPITQTIKSAANSVTQAATTMANKATSQIKSMLGQDNNSSSSGGSSSSWLPW